MTTYKEIFGKPIKFISSDLSNDAGTGETTALNIKTFTTS